MSHYDSRGNNHKGTGYWGIKKKCVPVSGLNNNLPDWLYRAKQEKDLPSSMGTTLSILGFDPVKGWQNMLAASVAENFFGAIERGRLEVTVDDALILGKKTIRDIFSDVSIRASIGDLKGEPDRFDNSRLYLDAISSNEEVIVEHAQNQHLGDCELRIVVKENLPKKVALLRDGMLITEQLEGLVRFSDFKEFVAVVECQSMEGNKLLRAMEPPRHDDFEPDRLPTKEEKRKGRMALKELASWVRDMLKRHAQDPVSEVTSIDELREFFADEADQGKGSREGEEDPAGRIIIRARPVKRQDRSRQFETSQTANHEAESGDAGAEDYSADGDEEQEGRDGEHDSEGGRSNNGMDDSQSGTGAAASHQAQKNTPARVSLQNVRSVPLDGSSRRIAFTPDYSGEIKLAVQDSGADANYGLKIVGSTMGTVKEGIIDRIAVAAGQRCVLDIQLEGAFAGAMRVVADAV